jgi:hypothetical protein
MQPALDYLVGFYLITKELQSGLPVMSARTQRAGHGLEDFTLADRVIDGPVTHVLNHRDILGDDEAPHDEFQEIVDRTLVWPAAAVRNNCLVAHGEQFLRRGTGRTAARPWTVWIFIGKGFRFDNTQ